MLPHPSCKHAYHFQAVPGLVAMSLTGLMIVMTLAQSAQAQALDRGGVDPPSQGRVRVGMLVYDRGKTGVCFSEGFLTIVARETGANINRRFEAVSLAGGDLFEYPFMVMSGTGRFTLSQDELKNLKSYLLRGGFVLASAGCSNRLWAAGFQKMIREVFPDARLKPIGLDHPVFHTLYDIDRTTSRKGTDQDALFGLELHGRLVALFSPLGLNDTASAGKGCCCCGGNEVRNAAQINANILVYVLTH